MNIYCLRRAVRWQAAERVEVRRLPACTSQSGTLCELLALSLAKRLGETAEQRSQGGGNPFGDMGALMENVKKVRLHWT